MEKCEICKRECRVYSLSNHLVFSHKEITKEEYYKKYIMKDENENICKMYGKIKTCKKYTKFISIYKGFKQYCSQRCLGTDPEIKLKKKQTTLKNYGYENPSQVPNIKKKKEETSLKNFGVTHASKTKEFKEKSKKTCLKIYGFEYPSQSKEVQDKQKQTCLKIYGKEYPMQLKEIQDKQKQTCLKNFGVENPMQLKEIQDKQKQTCLKNFGFEYPSQSKEIQDKQKQTCLKNFGFEYPSQCDEIKEKTKKTCLKNLGFEYPMQSKEVQEKSKLSCLKNFGKEYASQYYEIKEKTKKTCLKNFGKEYPMQSKTIQEKSKLSCLKNLGFEYPMQSKKIQEKSKLSCLKNFGVENPTQSKEIQEKSKQTCLKKYGVEYIGQCSEIKTIIRKIVRSNFLVKLSIYLKNLNLELLDEKYIHAGFKHNWKCKICNTKFIQIWNEIQQGFLCPKCHPRNNGSSFAEKEIYNFICDLIGPNKVEHNCYNIIKNPITKRSLELDIYIPDKRIAIEFNGLYWHSEEMASDPENNHLIKTNLCLDKEIQLIHIFEDEWVFKKEIVKSKIKQILKINNLKKIYTKRYEIKEIDLKVKNEFLDKYHIQGKDKSKIKLGAFYNNELISVMTFSKDSKPNDSKSKDKVWELNRFCNNSNYHIPESANKLLSYFKKNYEWEEIFLYLDRRWGRGNIYYQLGFELEHIIKPDYWYLKDFKRIHKFNLRKTEDESMLIPEWILRSQDGYSRIWDCGSLKFKLYR